MAQFAVSATTVVNYDVTGHTRVYTCDYAATTAAGNDTVVTPLQVVTFASAEFIASQSTALTTAHYVYAFPSTTPGSVNIVNSTHDNFTVRFRVSGR